MRTGRKSLRRLIILSAGVGCAGVLIAVALPLRDWIVEGSKLRTVEKGPPEEQARALAWLLERGSMRAVPHLLEQILDPALERRLEATVEAIHALHIERSGGGNAEGVDTFRQPRQAPSPPRARSLREVQFAGVDRDTLEFLRSPDLQPAVQYGCVRNWTPFEDALITALKESDLALRAQALAVLLRVRSPSSVRDQRTTLDELKRSRPHRSWESIIAKMESFYDPRELHVGIAGAPPHDPFVDRGFPLAWSIRAAGVTKLDRAIPRLRELSVSTNFDTALAAERSLEDFEGPEADEALAHCLLAWSAACDRAGDALAERNKPYLKQILSNIIAPPNYRYWQAILLARAGSVDAVPILLSEVHKMAMIDREMFEHIGRLAQPRHRELIDTLPGRVRPEQADDAQAAVRRFEERFPPEERSP